MFERARAALRHVWSSVWHWLQQTFDIWDLHIYGGLIILYVSLSQWSAPAAGGLCGMLLVALGVFGPRLGSPRSET